MYISYKLYSLYYSLGNHETCPNRDARRRVLTLSMKSVSAILLAWAFSAAAFAVDLPFKKKPQQFTTRKPDDVAATLHNGTPQQRNDLALELGIFAPNPSGAAGKSNAPCVDFNHVEQRPVALRAGAENVLLLAESTLCDALYLVAFDKPPKSEWRHVQTVRLPARTRPPEIGFAELVQPGVSEIVVHGETTLDTGVMTQQNFVVLKMVGDRIEVVLDATERSQITLANRSPENTDNLTQTQASTFSLMKSAPNSAAAYRLLEKEVVTDYKTTITRYRVWTWDPQLQRFRPAPFDGGDVRPAPPPAKKPAAAAKPTATTPK